MNCRAADFPKQQIRSYFFGKICGSTNLFQDLLTFSTLLIYFVLKTLCSLTKQLRSVLHSKVNSTEQILKSLWLEIECYHAQTNKNVIFIMKMLVRIQHFK